MLMRKKQLGGLSLQDNIKKLMGTGLGPQPGAPLSLEENILQLMGTGLDAGPGMPDEPIIPGQGTTPSATPNTNSFNPAQAAAGMSWLRTGLSAIGSNIENNRQQQFLQNNLNNPYSSIVTDGRSNNLKYGYKKGGLTPSQIAKFLFDDDPTPKTVPVEEVPTRTEQTSVPVPRMRRNQETIQQLTEEPRTNKVSPSSSQKPVSGDAGFAFDYLQGKGVAPHVAAGMVGNFMQESNLYTGAVGDGGKARGIAQWHPDRYNKLTNWAVQNGKNPLDLTTQLDYALIEAKERGDLDKVSKATNSTEAANIFARHFERPKVIDPNRARYARQLYKTGGKYTQAGEYDISPEEYLDLISQGYQIEI